MAVRQESYLISLAFLWHRPGLGLAFIWIWKRLHSDSKWYTPLVKILRNRHAIPREGHKLIYQWLLGIPFGREDVTNHGWGAAKIRPLAWRRIHTVSRSGSTVSHYLVHDWMNYLWTFPTILCLAVISSLIVATAIFFHNPCNECFTVESWRLQLHQSLAWSSIIW